jgi:hypothetical protein
MDFYPSSARLYAKLTPVLHTGDDAHVARHDHSVSACCRSLKRVLSSVRFSSGSQQFLTCIFFTPLLFYFRHLICFLPKGLSPDFIVLHCPFLKEVLMGMLLRGGKIHVRHIPNTGKWTILEQV